MAAGGKVPRSLPELCRRLGIPVPTTDAGIAAACERGIFLLKAGNTSGYMNVFAVDSADNPWQAKPYIRPKVQRSLGSFPTKELAAGAVMLWAIGWLPSPPTPSKDRNKRNEGRRVRERRRSQGLQPALTPCTHLSFTACFAFAHRCFAREPHRPPRRREEAEAEEGEACATCAAAPARATATGAPASDCPCVQAYLTDAPCNVDVIVHI